ncbi:Peptidase-M1 domain-containing protein [Sulfidibacter corallicola]|uniref:Peptidase M1 membrane alanine aminopeptidase domain-containing protein n=1 Tax=Sulfidibacter corallicola TaxID=2818388 RepID=A0A8A4TKY5_SULCO|nr:M1 family aminopeptidase [Sulfidibacter corallicola]QTD50200.1 hypothetical protein J3U87_31835 [Sulfidibacter corallicola]
MLIRLFRFEIELHLRQTAVRLSALAFFLLGALMSFSLHGGIDVWLNAPFSIAFGTGILSLASPFALAVFAGNAILRDREHGMEEIVYATAVTRFQYLVSRGSGLVVVAGLVLGCGVLGLFLGSLLPNQDPESLGPHRIWPYLQAWLTIGLPNVLFGAAAIFAAAALTRSNAATYVAAVTLYLLYMLGSMLGNSPLMAQSKILPPEDMAPAVLMDPYGMIALFEQTRYWSFVEKNTQLLALEGGFLFNRMMWTAFSLSLFCYVYQGFSFRKPRPRKAGPSMGIPGDAPLPLGPYVPVPVTVNRWGAHLRAAFSKVAVETQVMVRGIPFVVMLLLGVFFVAVTIYDDISRGELNTPYLPLTSLILPVLQDPLSKLGPLVVLFFVSELAWFERGRGVAPIVDATAVPSGAMFLAKLLVSGMLIGVLILAGVLVAVAFQLLNGFVPRRPELYLNLFYAAGLPLLCYAAWVLCVQNLSPNKYLGMIFGVMVLLSGGVLRRLSGLDHPLFGPVFFPDLNVSDMIGRGYGGAADHWNMLFRVGLAGMVCALTLVFWRRGARRRTGGLSYGSVGLAALGTLVFLGTGGYVFYRVNYLNTFRGEERDADWRAQYERTYKYLAEEPAPRISDIQLNVDFYPDERRYRVVGRYDFVNETGGVIERIVIGVPHQNRREARVTVAHATTVGLDETFSMETYAFDHPLRPGDQGSLTFELEVTKSGFTDLDPENYVLPGAAYVELNKYLPAIGYDRSVELADPHERAKRGLGPYREMATLEAVPEVRPHHLRFEAVLSTPPGLAAVTLGRLVRAWDRDGRRYFHYRIARETANHFAVAVGRYRQARTDHRDVAISVWTAEGHEANVATVLEAAKASLDYFQDQWGSYPYDVLRIVEVPSFSGAFAATSYPTTIFAVEDRFFLMDQSDPADFNLVYRRTAHEIAHQWWGDQLEPAPAEGYRMLTETLAKYAEMVAYDAAFGPSASDDYLADMVDLYFFYRGYQTEPENPLNRVGFQPYVYYFKGGHAVHVLRELLGEGRVNQVLQTFFQRYRYPARPTSTDFLRILYDHAPADLHVRLRDLFERVVTFDLQLKGYAVEALPEGRYQVEADIWALRVEGVDTEGLRQGPVAEWLELAAYREDGSLIGKAHRVSLAEVRSRVRIELEEEPAALVLDPRGLMLEANRADNRVAGATLADESPVH